MRFLLSRRIGVLALAGALSVGPGVSSEAATMREAVASWQSPVCYLVSYGRSNSTGTGFLVLTRKQGTVLLFTARHVVWGQDSLFVAVGAYDSAGARIALSGMFTLEKEGRRIYNVSDTMQDCAWIAIETASLLRGKPPGYTISAVREDAFVKTSDLFPGLPVVFSGYPAGLSVGEKAPLSRRGSIAGIDAANNTILIDAMAVGGFSGSPVFLDKSQQISNTVPGVFVGLVYARTELNRGFVTQDSSTSLIIPENIGIARVVPADVLLPSVRLFKK